MIIKYIYNCRFGRILLASSLFSFITNTVQAMLVNSKEIAQNVKTAIIEAGTQVSSDFKDVIETTQPLWPNKYSCLTFLGVICAIGGMLFVYQGINQLINRLGTPENYIMGNQGTARIITGIVVCYIGIRAICIFGG